MCSTGEVDRLVLTLAGLGALVDQGLMQSCLALSSSEVARAAAAAWLAAYSAACAGGAPEEVAQAQAGVAWEAEPSIYPYAQRNNRLMPHPGLPILPETTRHLLGHVLHAIGLWSAQRVCLDKAQQILAHHQQLTVVL